MTQSPRNPSRDAGHTRPRPQYYSVSALHYVVQSAAQSAAQLVVDQQLIAAMKAAYGHNGKADHVLLARALAAGANPDRIIVNGLPALHVAVLAGDIESLRLLVAARAHVNDVNAAGRTALDVALAGHKTAMAEVLAAAGGLTAVTVRTGAAMLDVRENYQTRIDAALSKNLWNGRPVAELERIIALGARPMATDIHSKHGYSILHNAVYLAQYDKVQKLLAAGGDINAKTPYGEGLLEMLWWADRKVLMTPRWVALYENLRARGCPDFLGKSIQDLTPDDLRRTPPLCGHGGDTTLMHRLVAHGQADFVLDVLRRHPAAALTARDLRRSSAFFDGRTLLAEFAMARKLDVLFRPDIFQGRLNEMLSLREDLDKMHNGMSPADFNAAADDIRRERVRRLRLPYVPPRKPPAVTICKNRRIS